MAARSESSGGALASKPISATRAMGTALRPRKIHEKEKKVVEATKASASWAASRPTPPTIAAASSGLGTCQRQDAARSPAQPSRSREGPTRSTQTPRLVLFGS